MAASQNIQGSGGTNEAAAQAVAASSSYTLTRVTVKIARVASPTDNIQCDIATSIGGAALATATNTILGSSLDTVSAVQTFNFASISLTSGTTYYIRFTRSGARDITNYYTLDAQVAAAVAYTIEIEASGVWTETASNKWPGFATYDDSVALTKIEAQYLLANTGSFGGSTGLKNYDTLYDPAEWGGTMVFIHEGNGASGGVGNIKLQSDPHGTPTDITNSPITGVIQREQGAGNLTMPGASATIDVNVTSTGTLNASRILARWTAPAATASIPNKILSVSQAINRASTY